MSDAKPYTGPTITHQAVETLPNGDTRCWSRWTDGRVTHQDTRTMWHGVQIHGQTFQMASYLFVGFGQDEWLPPPPGLKWIDTGKP